jgi:hypothetical protein
MWTYLDDANITSKSCDLCWEETDITPYASWDGRNSYSAINIAGRFQGKPFKIQNKPFNLADQKCMLQCKKGYWSNWDKGSALINAVNPEHDQRCTSDNCKTFISAQNAGYCDACWPAAEVNTYETWIGKSSYSQVQIAGKDASGPFLKHVATNSCQLQCDTGYWSYFNSNASGSTDPLDQRCTWDNCKGWNHHEFFWLQSYDDLNLLKSHTTDILSEFEPADAWQLPDTYDDGTGPTVLTHHLTRFRITGSTKKSTLEGWYSNSDYALWEISPDGTVCWNLLYEDKFKRGHIEIESGTNAIQ